MPVLTAPDAPTHDLGATAFTSLATPSRGSSETSVWMVEIEPGTPPMPHQMTREEVFVVLAGRAGVTIGEASFEAGPGDTIVVPAHTTFALTAASTERLRALCCLPIGGQARIGDGEPFTPPWAL
jgi:mannose-6-phosphate isomerase-like protein (cupin superfamily)